MASKCPISNINGEDKTTRTVPSAGGFGPYNLYRLMKNGNPEFTRLSEELNSNVFRMNVIQNEIVLPDHESIKVCYDPSKVKKSDNFCLVRFNTTILKGITPGVFMDGVEHDTRKAALMKYLEYVMSNTSVNEITCLIENEFKNMPVYKDLSLEEANEIDFELDIKRAVTNVLTKIIFGEVISIDIINKFAYATLEFKYNFEFSRAEQRRVADMIFKLVEGTPYLLKLDEIVKDFKIEREIMVAEIIFNTFINGTRTSAISALLKFLELSDGDKQRIKSESENFLSATDRNSESLASLKTIHSFFLEVCRLVTPVPYPCRILKEDMVITSTSGNYEVKKGELMCGKVLLAQRDPELFDDPYEVSLDRDINKVEANLYTFGGKYLDEATATNFNCPGIGLGSTMIKVFTMFFSRCDVVPVSDLKHTCTNIQRVVGSDVPLKVKTFSYQNK